MNINPTGLANFINVLEELFPILLVSVVAFFIIDIILNYLFRNKRDSEQKKKHRYKKGAIQKQ